MISILLALKDNPTLTVLSYHLERYGFIVNCAHSAEDLIVEADRIEPNILIIDEDLPGNIRIESLCNTLKSRYKSKKIHIILASKTPQDENTNVDDYILKPFIPSAIVTKIKTCVQENQLHLGTKTLNYNGIEMQVDSFKVSRLGRTIHLGPTEFKILQCFLELPGKTLSRKYIMNHVWGYESKVDSRTVDVHINRLRSALREKNEENSLIRTIRSEGYAINISMSMSGA